MLFTSLSFLLPSSPLQEKVPSDEGPPYPDEWDRWTPPIAAGRAPELLHIPIILTCTTVSSTPPPHLHHRFSKRYPTLIPYPSFFSGLALLGLNNNARSSVTFDPVSPSGAADANQSTPTPQAALHKRAANPLIQVQEPTPRQPVLSRFGSDEGFVVGDGSPARKSNCSSGGGGSSPIGTAVPLPKASPPLPQLTTASSPLSVSHPERDTSWELDSDDEAATPTTSSAAGDKPSTAASQKDEVRFQSQTAEAQWPRSHAYTLSLPFRLYPRLTFEPL